MRFFREGFGQSLLAISSFADGIVHPFQVFAQANPDLFLIVELSQQRAPATFRPEEDQAVVLRVAQSKAFDIRLREERAQSGTSPQGPVVLFSAIAQAAPSSSSCSSWPTMWTSSRITSAVLWRWTMASPRRRYAAHRAARAVSVPDVDGIGHAQAFAAALATVESATCAPPAAEVGARIPRLSRCSLS